MQRRRFLRTVSRLGTVIPIVSVGLAGCTGTGDPGYVEGYLDSTKGWDESKKYENVVDKTDLETVSISVGAGPENHSFKPVAVEVSLGTTIVWKWTGKGGLHNIVSDPTSTLSLKSGSPKEIGEFNYTYTKNKTLLYYCDPHLSNEMKGAVIPSSPKTGTLSAEPAEEIN